MRRVRSTSVLGRHVDASPTRHSARDESPVPPVSTAFRGRRAPRAGGTADRSELTLSRRTSERHSRRSTRARGPQALSS